MAFNAYNRSVTDDPTSIAGEAARGTIINRSEADLSVGDHDGIAHNGADTVLLKPGEAIQFALVRDGFIYAVGPDAGPHRVDVVWE